MSLNIIAAVSSNGIIGKNNQLPFNYPEDLKFFKQQTINSTIIMGRKTFQSIGRPLPKRNNVVITSQCNEIQGVSVFNSLERAIDNCMNDASDVWLIGGHSIYSEGMKYAKKMLLTITPDVIEGDDLVAFPWICPLKFNVNIKDHPFDARLKLAEFTSI